MHEPNKEEWEALYRAAIEFAKASPWQWMSNEDLFEIIDPGAGQTGYCCVLGAGGEEFGLVLFLGKEGLAAYAKVVTHRTGKVDADAVFKTPALTLLFADRDELDKNDRQTIRSLGLTFRGRNAWPLFRSQKPGYMPWYLEQTEACFLTSALQQAVFVAEGIRKGELELSGNDEHILLVRQAEGEWKAEWRSFALPTRDSEPKPGPLLAAQQARLKAVAREGRPTAGTWELDISLLHAPIEDEGDRPYFPLCFLVIGREQGLIISTKVTEPWISHTAKREMVISMLEGAAELPQEIWVVSRTDKALVEPITSSLGIGIKVRSLKMARDVKEEMMSYLSMGA